ncbi:unnamed protein product [Camellia sinensis]
MFLPTKRNKRMKAIGKEIHATATLSVIIDKRLKAMKEGETSKDDLLDGMTIEEAIEEAIEECKLFYLVGQETTLIFLVWTMILLSRHQNWKQYAKEEELKVLGKDKPNFDGVNRLKI